MAELPDIHFQETQSPVIFTNVGVDYLGPFAVVHRDTEVKTYICLFTCLVTRAIHLEVAEDLSTDKCRTAIRLFIARRGQPRLFLSDNGFNFLGARKQIRRRPLMLDHDYIKDQLLNQSVEWKLSPPSAPHFVAVWERLVQCVKRALLLNLGSAKLTRDVFATIISEAECLVTHVRSNHEDDNPLTPNHFLLGRPFCNVPGAVFNETLTLKSSAWTQVKQRLQQNWKRLLTEFVPSLNKRPKWASREATLEVNDVVWLLEEFTPRGIWPLGRVTRTFTGPDNIARSWEVKTTLGKLNRTAIKILHVYPKPTSSLGLGCVGPEDVNASH